MIHHTVISLAAGDQLLNETYEDCIIQTTGGDARIYGCTLTRCDLRGYVGGLELSELIECALPDWLLETRLISFFDDGHETLEDAIGYDRPGEGI